MDRIAREPALSRPDPGRRRLCGAGMAGLAAIARAAGIARTAALARLTVTAGALLPPSTVAAAAENPAAHEWAPVRRGTRLAFPADHGAHPGHRAEWWYLTGWLRRPDGREAGFQVTFFRIRTLHPADNPSRFAPTQMILAHAALSLPERASLLRGERAARAGFDPAGAQVGDTRVWVGVGDRRWRIERDAVTDRYRTQVATAGFALDLALAPDGPPLPQGDAGYSRKGANGASHYYSRPQLAVTGTISVGDSPALARSSPATIDAMPLQVTGRAWFDHEWWSDLLDPGTAGWDWVGLNLDDGTALMAFRLRDEAGNQNWRDGTIRDAQGHARTGLAPVFTPLRTWRSSRSGASYPVAMLLELAGRRLELRPMLDDQELDTRASTGTIYWEGAVTVHEAGRRIGQGHMELTGYAGPIRF
jgi:predicted secreted hydrolase